MWQRRRFRFLLNIIDHLPRDSAFVEAVAQDDEMAELNADRIASATPPAARVTEFGPTQELLAAIWELLGILNTNFVAANSDPKKGGKPKQPKPWPRPETAADRLKRRHSRDGFLDIVNKFAPHEAARFSKN